MVCALRYEWCNQNYAYLDQWTRIYETGFADTFDEDVISDPSWDELEAEDPVRFSSVLL